ncbi:hypothetical protein C2S51_018108 [Perilla frutescens var. frutescens]|nr:hypothetical protein C2S51_018108 [Perilla frutescens var. frutescens]
MNKDDGVSWHIKTDESDELGMIIQISVNGEMSRFVKCIGLEILCSSPSQETLNLNSYFGLGPKVEKYLFSDTKASDGCLLPEYLIVNRSNSGSKGMPTDVEWSKAGVVNLIERNELVLDGVPVCPNLVLLFLQRNNRLRHVPASFFDRMSVLSFLDLSNTRIKELPSSLFTLENLQVLLLRSCVCLKSLHADIKNLKKLEVLDALGTNLHNIPKEIEELSQLRHLHLSFYFPDYGSGYAGVPSELIPPGATFQLQVLQALSIVVHPEDERWKKIVSNIIQHVVKLEKLSYLQFYFPTVEDLKSFIEESPSWKEHRLKRFKFIVGHDIKRIISRVPDEVESKYDQHDRCLRFVNGSEVPQVMKRILSPVTAFYLDHHSEIQSLSEFGISNFKELRFCVVRECPNIQFVIIVEESQSAAFPNLEYLGLHYLWELERIWERPVPSGSFEALKYLMVATCPKLEYIASRSTLQSLSKLETFIIEDCESLKSVVEENEMVKYDDASLLPRLTRLVLRHLPQLVAFGSDPLFLSEEMHIDIHCCPKLIVMPSLSNRDYNVNMSVGAPGVETSQVHKSEISHEDSSSLEGIREKMPIGGCDSYDVSEHSNEVVFQPELSVLESESNPSELQIEMNKCDGGCIACPRGTDQSDELGTSIPIPVSGEMSRPARSRKKFLGCFSNYGDISISVKPPVIGAVYSPFKDLFLHVMGQRRDIKDLEDSVSHLMIRLRLIYSMKERIDRLLRNSVFTEQSEEYRVMKADIDVIHKRCTEFINKYTKTTSSHLSSTTELDISTVSSMIDKLHDLKLKMVTFKFSKLAKLRRDIVKLSTRASEALDRLKPEYMMHTKLEQNQEKWNDDNGLPVFNTYVDEVLECLHDSDNGNIVGIFGPVGVGKTTVLRKLHNRLIEQKSLSHSQFDNIIWIEYPDTEYNIVEKLQNELMEQLNIGHEATESTCVNANTISTFLHHKKYILLMDQVSNYIDLGELGLSEHHENKNVVIASRSRRVVLLMTEHVVEIQRLGTDEAWTLFENRYGHKIYDPHKIIIAHRIIECCAGIPWMINQVGKYLKDEENEGVWVHVMHILQSEPPKSLHLFGLEGIDKAYEMIYEGLEADTKKCLLYAALFPIEYNICSDYLIECWIAEGFMVENAAQKVRLNRDKGQTILKQLTDQHLLQWSSDNRYIKISPNIRRVALQLDYPDEEKCLIWASSKYREPTVKTWTTITRMSLIGCNAELPESPECCNIRTLLLQSLKPKLERIPDLFFDHMEYLHVLDLNHTEIRALPTSISKLVNLKSLYLNDCNYLVALPPEAARLVNLEFLDICGTSIHSLPQQIKYMVNLRCLRASLSAKRGGNHSWEAKQVEDLELIIPGDIINNLRNLEELSIGTTFDCQGGIAVAERLATELASLEYLTTLYINFPNVKSVVTFVDQSKSLKNIHTDWGERTLRSFKIIIGCNETQHPYESDFSGLLAERWLRYCTSEEFSSACKELLKQASAFEIIGHDGVKTLTCSQFELHSVQVCVVEGCCNLKNIVDGYIISEKQGNVSQSLLQNLEKLYLYDLHLLECIWDGPVPYGSLTNLTTITINGCPRLRKILDTALAHTLQNLQFLKVQNCCEISKIIEVVGMSDNSGQEGRRGKSEIAEVHESSSNWEKGDLSDILKSLRKIELSDLPILQSICNSTSISWNSLNSIIVTRCSKLSNLSLTSTNAKKLALIQGEKRWWETLQFPDEMRQRSLPFFPRREASTSEKLEFNPEEEIASSNNNTSI